MDSEKHRCTLDQIPANRKLIEQLYSNEKITKEARDYALNLLEGHNQWGLWTSRILLTIGAALLLAGIIFFFAFNWVKITPLQKLASIQLGIIACLIGAYFLSTKRMSGRVLLLSGSVLVGVFMAVFGQIYQTGADAYQLFMMWSLLTLGWTLISNFAAQWVFWLVITNFFLALWWWQAALPAEGMESMIFIYLALLNSFALALREYYAVKKNYKWLQARWLRMMLTIASLLFMMIPILNLIAFFTDATKSIIFSSITGFIGYGTVYYIYRYKLPDMWSLTTTVLSGCIILEFLVSRALFAIVPKGIFLVFAAPGILLVIGLITLGIFTTAITYLRKVSKLLEVNHA